MSIASAVTGAEAREGEGAGAGLALRELAERAPKVLGPSREEQPAHPVQEGPAASHAEAAWEGGWVWVWARLGWLELELEVLAGTPRYFSSAVGQPKPK